MIRCRRIPFPLALLAILGLVAALLAPPAAHAAIPREPSDPSDVPGGDAYEPPAAGFDWRAESRFGIRNAEGMIEYNWRDSHHPDEQARNTYRPEYVHPASFRLTFTGCTSEREAALSPRAQNTYVWERVHPDGTTEPLAPTASAHNCTPRFVFPGQGDYTVRLTITDPDGEPVPADRTPAYYEQIVTVRDHLIVSLGDSYASGEGNPDIPQVVHGKQVIRHAKWQDERCHRSAHAGAAKAAMALEAADPKSSVTFISFACSGATVDTRYFDGGNPFDPYEPVIPANKPVGSGMLGTYRGSTWETYNDHLPSQIDQLRAAVAPPNGGPARRIDALIMSGGGNDIGFGPIASVCVLYGDCENYQVINAQVSGKTTLANRFQQSLAALPGKYARLDDALETFDIGRVYATEYPDPSRDDNGDYCGEMMEDILPAGMSLLLTVLAPLHGAVPPMPWYHIDREETEWASTTVLAGLNQAVEDAALANGWQFVDGISAQFNGPGYGHGYCADNGWIRRASDSVVIQGPLYEGVPTDTSKTIGTLHPTAEGHQAYANMLVPALATQLLDVSDINDPAPPAFTTSHSDGAVTSRAGANGWLTGRCVAGACTSGAPVLTVEARDPTKIRGAAFTVNGAPATCATPPAGVTCTESLVDANTYRWVMAFSDGVYRVEFTVSGRDGQLGSVARELKVDLTDPISAHVAVSSDAAPTSGWYRTPVRFTLGGADAAGGSGIARVEYDVDNAGFVSGDPGQLIDATTDGRHTIRARPVDWAGRRGPVSEAVTVDLDGTAPAIACDPADTAWHAEDVTLSCVATDATSGLVDSADGSFVLGTSVPEGTETGHATTSSRTVCDVAGNCGAGGPFTNIRIDKRGPEVAITSPTNGRYVRNQSVAAEYTCTDGGSGIASCVAPVANGAALDTTTLGTHTFTVVATDGVGRSSMQYVTYDVRYAFSGFRQPIHSSGLNPAKAGSSVPVKFSLGGDQGLDVFAEGYPKSRRIDCDSSAPVGASGATGTTAALSYDAAEDQYNYVWKTEKSWANTCRELLVRLADDTEHVVRFQFR